MSFTAEVKDELARVDGPTQAAQYAQLSAIMRVCGTLSFRGPGRYSIKIATETGAVARTAIKLTHKLFDATTSSRFPSSPSSPTPSWSLASSCLATALPPACPGTSCAPAPPSRPSSAVPSWRAASSQTPAASSTSRSP